MMDITLAETEVMRVLWSKSPSCSREIIDSLLESTEWKEGTIKSLISRLINKGYITKDTSTKPFALHANIAIEDAVLSHTLEAMAPVCHLKRGEMLGILLSEIDLSQGDCQQLIELLKTKKETAPTQVACQCPKGQCQCHHHAH